MDSRHTSRKTQINHGESAMNAVKTRRTQINEDTEPRARRTQVNSPDNESRRTQVNTAAAAMPETAEKSNIQAGEQVADGLTVQKRLNVGETGEADLFLCSYYGSNVVMKLYRRDKDKLLEGKRELNQALSRITNGSVVQIVDSGVFHNRYYEVMPYYDQYGSLEDRLQQGTLSLQEIEQWIVPQMLVALETIHTNGIFHRDIKPENIMIDNDGKTLALIDFGVAHMGEHTIMVTNVGGTSEYMAPEVYNRIFLPESDYYALGITLYKLFMGSTPFSNMNEENALQTAILGEIPRPDKMPTRLHDLIAALTYKDLSHRNDASNPNHRWKAQDIKIWLSKKPYVVPGRQTGKAAQADKFQLTRAVTFNGQQYTNPNELLVQMALNWEEGKAFLNRGELFRALAKNKNTRAATQLWQMQNHVDNAREDEPEDVRFFKFLNEFMENDGHFYWVTGAYESLQEFGDELLRVLLEHGDASRGRPLSYLSSQWSVGYAQMYPAHVNVVKYNLAGLFLNQIPDDKKAPDHKSLMNKLNAFSALYAKDEDNFYAMFSYAYLLAENRIFLWKKEVLHTADDLKKLLVKVRKEDNISSLMETLSMMVQPDGKPIPDLDAWLAAQQRG